jgi:hypothetical protein
VTVTYLNPTAEAGLAVHPYELFLDTSAPFTLGLVANTFPDGARFMDKLEVTLQQLAPHAVIRRYQKPGLLPVEGEQLTAIQRECDAVVAGWGH